MSEQKPPIDEALRTMDECAETLDGRGHYEAATRLRCAADTIRADRLATPAAQIEQAMGAMPVDSCDATELSAPVRTPHYHAPCPIGQTWPGNRGGSVTAGGE